MQPIIILFMIIIFGTIRNYSELKKIYSGRITDNCGTIIFFIDTEHVEETNE